MAKSVWVQLDIGNETFAANTTRLSTLAAASVESGDALAAAPGPRFIKTPGEISNFRVRRTATTLNVSQTVTCAEGATGTSNIGPSITYTSAETGDKLDDTNTGRYELDDLASVKVASTGGTGTGTYRMFSGLFEADTDTVTLAGCNSSGNPTVLRNVTTYMNVWGERRLSTESFARNLITMDCDWENMSVHIDLNEHTTNTTFRSRVNGGYGNQSITILALDNESRWVDDSNTDTLSSGDFVSYEIATGNSSDAGHEISFEKSSCTFTTTNSQSAVSIGGNYVTFGSSETTYAPWGGIVQNSATESDVQHPLGMDVTASHLGADVPRTSTGSSSITITSRINGVDGNQSVTLVGVASAIDDTNTDDVLADDDVSTKWVSTVGGGRVQSVVFRLTPAVTAPGGIGYLGGWVGRNNLGDLDGEVMA